MLVKWKRVDTYWFEKTTVTCSGKPIVTYHFQRKSADAFPEIIFDTKISRQLAGYTLIEKDIRDTRELLKEHNILFARCDNPGESLLLKGLMKAIVITYGKCFTAAKGRKIKLELSHIKSPQGIELHNGLIDMRNQYVAHGGVSSHEKVQITLLCPSSKEIKKIRQGKYAEGSIILGKKLLQTTTTNEFNHEDFEILLQDHHDYVLKKISDLANRLGVNKIDPEKVWQFVGKKKSLIIDEKLLEKLKY
ncbi:Uncharacterised protein [Legionella pneumophila]|uniref:hypothetical protein n=1 Tax=Legionella pneumophila TaxID=446 RepID=UPI000770AEF5|nr:hypothetical protein [Legionella pneumophila]MCH9161250.1 hypothetical protein [Legionella pneumophila serogroup 1]MCH9167574.1 hypothetical protein [Legionella pneumophila serogroup 1]MCH9176171.1 hypothetical protein [Legionella pneumophila serogroup 1]MCH9179527.1 hypothetical protein [Legionella pneumophila serogroup 1]MCH9188524.1 hypothetical protein [Legionella pneumophila serogroup 1]